MSTENNVKTILVICLLVLLMVSCQGISLEKTPCPIDELLIETSNLPGNQWEEVGSRSYRDTPSRLGIERIGTGFSTSYYGVAEENVYRFRNEEDAKAGYLKLIDLWHKLETEGTQWSLLNIASDLAVNADERHLECSISSYQSVKTCWYMARYRNTVIEFRIAMIIVSEKDLFSILEIIDQKAKTCNEQ